MTSEPGRLGGAGLGPEQFETLLRAAQEQLGRVRGAAPDPDAEPAVGQGEALEGRVRAVMDAGGLRSLDLDPRVMRLASQEVAEAVRDAVNAAMQDLRDRPAPAGVPTADLGALHRDLEELQTEGLRQMSLFTETLRAAMGGRRG